MKLKLLLSELTYNDWKRKNVTYRGMKKVGEANQVYGSIGNGLYTVPLSNKSMAKQYGDVYFVVNAIPKNPKIFDGLNSWEIFRHKLKANALGLDQNELDVRDFEKNGHTIEDEMQKLGYDGVIIKGREMVNYKPKDVKYFKTEQELENYFNNGMQTEQTEKLSPSLEKLRNEVEMNMAKGGPIGKHETELVTIWNRLHGGKAGNAGKRKDQYNKKMLLL